MLTTKDGDALDLKLIDFNLSEDCQIIDIHAVDNPDHVQILVKDILQNVMMIITWNISDEENKEVSMF